MDERKSGEKDFQRGFPDSSQNDYQRRRESSKKVSLVSNNFVPNEDASGGERVASFLVAANFTDKDDGPNHYSKEGFHPSRPILWARGKYKSPGGNVQSSQTKPYYSDMVARRTGKDIAGKDDGGFAHRTRNQRSTLRQPSATHNMDASNRDESTVEKKKAISHRRCFEAYDPTSKDEKYHPSFFNSDRPPIPRMRSEREDISQKRVKATSPEECNQDENHEKAVNFKGTTTVPKKEKLNPAESKKKNFSFSKAVEGKDSGRSHQVSDENHKSAKFKVTAKDPVVKKMAKTTTSNIDKDELKSKSENHVSDAFKEHLPGRIPGTYSLIDIEKLKQKHARCCRECLEARARSPRPCRNIDKKEDSKKMTGQKPTTLVVPDTGSSEDQLENSIVFFRNALNAVDLVEKLFQNIGSTKEFLKDVYVGLEESSDVARCRRNMTEAHGSESAAQQQIVPQIESKEKVTSENHEDETKKKAGKPKRKDHITFKSGATGQSSDNSSLKQELKTKTKRDRVKNLLELSDDWKKRNQNAKQ